MERSEVCDILEALADGLAPVTCLPLPEASPYHHPKVLRALYSALLEMRRASTNRDGGPIAAGMVKPGPANAGKPWPPHEDARLSAAYDEGETIAALSKVHRRTTGAIESRLIRLGKFAPGASARPNLGRPELVTIGEPPSRRSVPSLRGRSTNPLS